MPLLRSRFPSLYRFAASLALLAMLVPVGVSFAHHPATIPAFIHICGLDTHENGGQDKAPAHKPPSCPICQSLHLLGGGFVPPVIAAVVPVSFAAAIYIPIERIFPARSLFAPQARPRAPPSLV